MQRFLLLLLFGIFLYPKLSADLPTLNEIIDRHAEAMGGKAKWQQLKSWKMAYTIEDGHTVTAFARKPHQFKLIFKKDGQRMRKGYAGERGWTEIEGKIVPMRSVELVEMAEEPEFYEELMLYKEKGYTAKLIGKEKLNRKKFTALSYTKTATMSIPTS